MDVHTLLGREMWNWGEQIVRFQTEQCWLLFVVVSGAAALGKHGVGIVLWDFYDAMTPLFQLIFSGSVETR
jgi:hypothetical protein